MGARTEVQGNGEQCAIDPDDASEARAHLKVARRGRRNYPVQEDKGNKDKECRSNYSTSRENEGGSMTEMSSRYCSNQTSGAWESTCKSVGDRPDWAKTGNLTPRRYLQRAGTEING